MKKQLSSLILLLLLPVLLHAQSVQSIVDRHLDAIGGEAAIQSVDQVKANGTVTMMGMEFPVVMYIKSPGKSRMEMDIMGQKMIQASNGETAWQVNPMAGITEPTEMPLENAQTEDLTDEILLMYGEEGYTFTYVGEEELEGTPVYRLDIETKDGIQQHLFDQETGARLAIRIEIPEGPQKGQVVLTKLSEYEAVNGYWIPHKMDVSINYESYMTINLEKISKEPIEDSLFEIDG